MCGAFYPNYFEQQANDEVTADRDISGYNPCTTVMVLSTPLYVLLITAELYVIYMSTMQLVAWHSGRTSVSGRRTFPVLRSTCRWWVTTNVGKPFAIGQPTKPTQPFILSGSIKWVVSWNQMYAAVYRLHHLVKATKVNAGLAESNGRLLLGIWRDSLHVTCGLTACTPGSAPGPMLGNEYGKTLPFYYAAELWNQGTVLCIVIRREWVTWWHNGMASDLQSRGLEFEPQPSRGCVPTPGKLFAHVPLQARSIIWCLPTKAGA